MIRSPSKSAVARAHCLAELAAALDEAHRQSLQLARVRPDIGEAVALRIRIVALRDEVENLRRGNDARRPEPDPIWPFHRHWHASE